MLPFSSCHSGVLTTFLASSKSLWTTFLTFANSFLDAFPDSTHVLLPKPMPYVLGICYGSTCFLCTNLMVWKSFIRNSVGQQLGQHCAWDSWGFFCWFMCTYRGSAVSWLLGCSSMISCVWWLTGWLVEVPQDLVLRVVGPLQWASSVYLHGGLKVPCTERKKASPKSRCLSNLWGYFVS